MPSYRLQCPKCHKALQVQLPGAAPGQATRTRCSQCGNEFNFRVPETAAKQRPKAQTTPQLPPPANDDPFGNLNLPPSSPTPQTTFRNPPPSTRPARQNRSTGKPKSKLPISLIVGALSVCVVVGIGLWLVMGGFATLPEPLRAAVRTVAPMTDSRESVVADLKATELELKEIVMSLIDKESATQQSETNNDSKDLPAVTDEESDDQQDDMEQALEEIAGIRLGLTDLLIRATALSPMPTDEVPDMDQLKEILTEDPFSEEEKDRLQSVAREMDREKAMSMSLAIQSVVPFLKLVSIQIHVVNIDLPDDASPVEQLAFEQLQLERAAINSEAKALREMTKIAIDADDPETVTKRPEWNNIVDRTEKELAVVTSDLKSLAERVRTAFREQTYTGDLDAQSAMNRALSTAIQSRLMLDRQFKSMSIGESAKEGIAEIQRSSSLVQSMYRNFKSPSEKPKTEITKSPSATPAIVSSQSKATSSDRTSSSIDPGTSNMNSTNSRSTNPLPGNVETESSRDRVARSGQNSSTNERSANVSPAGPGLADAMSNRRPGFMRREPGAAGIGGPRFGPRGGGGPRSMGAPRGAGGSRPEWIMDLATLKDVRDLKRPQWANKTIVLRTESGQMDVQKILPVGASVDPTQAGFRSWLSELCGQQVASQSNSSVHVYHLGGATDLQDIVDQIRNVGSINFYPDQGYAELSVQ